MSSTRLGILVVIPTLDEGQALEDTLMSLNEVDQVGGAYVVYGKPPLDDDLPHEPENSLFTKFPRHRLWSRGPTYGDAVLTGMALALRQAERLSKDYIRVVIVVMDVGHDINDILPILKHDATHDAFDIICGERNLRTEEAPLLRKMLSKLARILCKRRSNTPIADVTNGFRAYKPSTAQAIFDTYCMNKVPSYGFNMMVAMHPSITKGKWKLGQFYMKASVGKTHLNFKEVVKVAKWWFQR